jgi:hypothetical protein
MTQWERIAAAIVAVALAAAPAAHAGESVKTERSSGKLVSYDAATQTLVMKEKGKDQAYAVKPEGSVLTRTTVTMNAKPAKFDELRPGMIMIVYWKPDPADASKRFARKIDVPKIPREFQEDVEAAERAESGG